MSDFRQDISQDQLISDTLKSISINVLDQIHAIIYLEMTQKIMSIDELNGMSRALGIIKKEIKRLSGED